MVGHGQASGKNPEFAELTRRLGFVPAGFRPLLVMDVWEHAFMRDYKATERAKYIEAFFRNIDWRMVDRRFQEPSAQRLPG